MSLPVLRLSGSPYEQGLRHGRELKERVAHNLAVYFDRFATEGRLPRAEVLLRARRYAAAMEAQNAAYCEGLRGIAEGSGFEYEELVALNVRYEILYHQYTENAIADADACTAFAVAPEATANGHLLMGQNWDWVPQVLGAVLHTVEPDGLETLAFTEAGIFGGKIGLNSAGLGLAINGLLSTQDDWSRLRKPFHVRCYEILRSRDLESAVRVVTDHARACSTNFLIAQAPDRIVDLEAAPETFHRLDPEDGCLTHANHFTDGSAIGVSEPPLPRRAYSCNRQARLRELILGSRPVTVAALQAHLRDHQEHPNSICRHPDETLPPTQHSITVTAVIIDLHDQTMLLTDRQPCENPFQEVSLRARVDV